MSAALRDVGDTAAERSDVAFQSGDVTCRAWLYRPHAPTPPPVIVMAHGLGGVREMRLDAFAERFRDTSYACLVFDYRHFGASDGEPRQLLHIGRQLEDWRNAITHARHLADVDGSRVCSGEPRSAAGTCSSPPNATGTSPP